MTDLPAGIDAAYLADALSRAKVSPPPAGDPSVEALTGGRTGAQVLRLRCADGTSYVLKLVPELSWRSEGLGCAPGGEAKLWLSRLLAGDLAIRWPALDVSRREHDDRYWLLMSDVSDGICDRGAFTRADTRRLLPALAEMHAYYAGHEILSGDWLPSVRGTIRMMAEPLLMLAGKQQSSAPWVTDLTNDFQVIGAFLPIFLDVAGPKLADAFIELVADESWQQRLEQHPPTLLHGDLRRANISFQSDHIALFDWEFASSGPPACDLQLHFFFQRWAYPGKGEPAGGECHDLRDEYLAALEKATGEPVDRTAFEETWKLGWLKIIAQLGFLLIDPLVPDGGTPDERERAQSLTRRAIERALTMRESLG